jgi:hypothetical protein
VSFGSDPNKQLRLTLMKIAISYRRSDNPALAGRISDKLADYYGHDKVFRDIENIPYGVDFRKYIQKELDQCDVLIAIVGQHWLGTDNNLRILDERDYVRIEIENALRRGVPILPLLIDGAKMPEADQLPESLKDFAYYNAAEVDSGVDFKVHVERVRGSIDGLLNGKSSVNQEDGAVRSSALVTPSLGIWTRRNLSLVLLGLIAVSGLLATLPKSHIWISQFITSNDAAKTQADAAEQAGRDANKAQATDTARTPEIENMANKAQATDIPRTPAVENMPKPAPTQQPPLTAKAKKNCFTFNNAKECF